MRLSQQQLRMQRQDGEDMLAAYQALGARLCICGKTQDEHDLDENSFRLFCIETGCEDFRPASKERA